MLIKISITILLLHFLAGFIANGFAVSTEKKKNKNFNPSFFLRITVLVICIIEGFHVLYEIIKFKEYKDGWKIK